MADTQATAEEQKFKYIDITNWDKYQTEGAGMIWIKDYVDKEGDYDYSLLTALQRYVFDGLCRLRGRFAQRIHNDPTYISQALCMVRRDRPHVAHAVRTLYTHGLLTLTNEPLNLQNRVDKIKNRVDKNRTISMESSDNSSDSTKTQEHPVKDSAEDFAEMWMKLMEYNKHWSGSTAKNWKNLLIGDFEKLLSKWSPSDLHELLAYSQSASQAQWNHTTKTLLDNGAKSEQFKNLYKEKAPAAWSKILARYNGIIVGSEQRPDVDSAAAPSLCENGCVGRCDCDDCADCSQTPCICRVTSTFEDEEEDEML